MVTAIVGGLVGWAFAGAAGITAAASIWQCVMIGMSLGSLVGGLISGQSADYDSSPTYSFGSISNTMSQNVPIPIVYGGTMRVAGNIIYQAFDSDEKKVQKMYVLISEGEVESITEVMANDSYVTSLPDCSLSIYTNTTSSTNDSRDPSGTRPYPNDVAIICMTLTASEELSSAPTITSLVKGVRVWTPSGKIWSDNPIWCAVDLLANPRYGLGVCTYDTSGNYDHPDWDKIDYASAVSAANYCDGTVDGEARFKLTYVLDTQNSIKDALSEILNTCRGYMVETDKIEFHIDSPVTNYTREITEGHIVEGSFTWWQKTSEDQYNQFTIDWCDPGSSYDRVTDVFQEDTDIAKRGLVTNSVQLIGITRQTQVARMGSYLLKTSLLVRNMCSFNVGVQDFDILPGEVIAITYPSFTGWNKKWFRVISTKPVDDLQMTVTCGEYIAECYDDSTMSVVAHIDTQVKKNYTPKDVTNLSVTEEVTVAEDGQYINTAIAIWEPSSYANSVEVWYRFDNEAAYTMAATLYKGSTEYRLDCTTHSVVFFKIVTVSSIGVRSAGVTLRYAIKGDTTPPATPTDLSAIGGYRLVNLAWTDPSDADLDHIDIYRSTDSSDYIVAGRSFRGEQAFIDSNLSILTNYWYKLKAVDSAGNESEFSDTTQAITTAIPPVDIPDYSIDGKKTVTDVFGDNTENANAIVEQVLNNYNDNKQSGVRISEVKEVLDDVTGRWYVKIDNDKRVAGLALYNGKDESDFTVLADKFFIYGTGEESDELKQVFAVDTTTGKVVLQGDLLADGSITGAKINATAKIQLGNGGELLMGTGSILQMASGAIVLDSENGVLQIKDPNNLDTGDYIRVETGDISTFTYVNGLYYQLKSLRQMAWGEAENGVSTTVGGVNTPTIFASIPKIMVSPATTQTYNPNYSTQPQTLRCYADNIVRDATTGIVTFTPKADLIIAPQVVTDTTLRTYHTQLGASILATGDVQATLTVPSAATNIRITLLTAGYTYMYNGDKVFYDMVPNVTISADDGSTSKTFVTADRQNEWKSARSQSSWEKAYDKDSIYFPDQTGYNMFEPNFPTYEHYSAYETTDIAGNSYTEYGWSHFGKEYTISFNSLSASTVTITAKFEPGAFPHQSTPYNYHTTIWTECTQACLAITKIQYQTTGTTQLATGTLNYMAIAE